MGQGREILIKFLRNMYDQQMWILINVVVVVVVAI